MKKTVTQFALALLCATSSLCSLPMLQAQTNWNRFRGENGVGVIETCTAPLPWTKDDVAWTATLPGKAMVRQSFKATMSS